MEGTLWLNIEKHFKLKLTNYRNLMKKNLKTNTHAKSSYRILMLLFLCCFFLPNLWAQEKIVTGTVVDEQDLPMIGVSVTVKGTTIGSITDLDGNFSLKVNDSNATLLFSYVGYVPIEMQIGDKTRFDIMMKEDSEMLDEVVVIGFQSQRKVNLTGAITRVNAETVENKPVANMGEALQGTVPGLNISIGSGAPNEIPDINIRGAGSMKYDTDSKKWVTVNNSPLILIDGVEVTPTIFNQLNPNDVDNISVLKDASAAAIYGTKATYGVLLVQTKSGSFNQKSKVSYSYEASWDQVYGVPDLPSSYDHQSRVYNKKIWSREVEALTNQEKDLLYYLDSYRKDPRNTPAFHPSGSWEQFGGRDMTITGLEQIIANKDNLVDGGYGSFKNGLELYNGLLRSGINWNDSFNPYNEVLRDWTPVQKHNVSVSGGGSSVSYFASLGILDRQGMYNINTDQYKRYNASASFNAKVFSWFNLGTKVTFNQTKYSQPVQMPSTGNIWKAMKQDLKSTTMPLLTPAYALTPNAMTDHYGAYLHTNGTDKDRRTTTIITVSPEFIILPNELTAKIDYSYNPQTYQKTIKRPKQDRINTSWTNPTTLYTEKHTGEIRKFVEDQYILNAYLNYNKTFFKEHEVSALLGFNQQRSKKEYNYMYFKDLWNYNILDFNASWDPTVNTFSNSSTIETGRALFMRLSYNFQGKYLFDFNARYDGSSNFPKDNRYKFFPTVGFGWRVSEEKFMEPAKAWLDNFKIRYSWGKLGSQPGAYKYQSVLGSEFAIYTLNGKPVNSMTSPGLVNPYMQWEYSVMNDVGLEFAFLKNRLVTEFAWYQREVKDILAPGGKTYPALLGATPPLENAGETRTRGWELNVKWQDKFSNGLSYSLGFNISDYQTKLTFPGNSTLDWETKNGRVNLISGNYDGEIWGYKTGGILQESDFDGYNGNNWVYYGATQIGQEKNQSPGKAWYEDLNGDGIISTGDGTIDDPGDLMVIGNRTPRYQYGITMDASWKGFDLSLFFRGVGKRDAWIDGGSTYWGDGSGSQRMLDQSWTPDNTNAKYPIYNSIGYTPQSAYVIDASYFSLKQIVLGYSLPKSIVKKARLDNIRLNFSVYNAFIISDLPNWYEPERLSDLYPPKRTLGFGIQVGF